MWFPIYSTPFHYKPLLNFNDNRYEDEHETTTLRTEKNET